jgi:hypothetical protein
MMEELNAIVGQIQGQVNELNTPLSAPALTPTSSEVKIFLSLAMEPKHDRRVLVIIYEDSQCHKMHYVAWLPHEWAEW